MTEAQLIIRNAFDSVVNDMLFKFTPTQLEALRLLADAMSYLNR